MSTIKDEEELYQNLKNLSINNMYVLSLNKLVIVKYLVFVVVEENALLAL